jgi:hypothetical protein
MVLEADRARRPVCDLETIGRRTRAVRVRIAGRWFAGKAVEIEGGADELQARRRLAAKYQRWVEGRVLIGISGFRSSKQRSTSPRKAPDPRVRVPYRLDTRQWKVLERATRAGPRP